MVPGLVEYALVKKAHKNEINKREQQENFNQLARGWLETTQIEQIFKKLSSLPASFGPWICLWVAM